MRCCLSPSWGTSSCQCPHTARPSIYSSFTWYALSHLSDKPAGTHTSQTWSTLVLSQPPLGVEVVGILVVRLFFFLAPALLFLLFDSIVPSLAVGLKTQDAPALPTRTGSIHGAKKSKRRPQWYSVLGISLLNICLSIALQAAVELLFTKALKIRSALKITTTLPMPWSIAKDVTRGLVLREVSLHDIYEEYPLTMYRFYNTIYTASSSTQNHRTSSASAMEHISTSSPRPTPW